MQRARRAREEAERNRKASEQAAAGSHQQREAQAAVAQNVAVVRELADNHRDPELSAIAGQTLMEDGKLDDGFEYTKRAINRAPKNPDYWVQGASILAAQGRYGDARKFAAKALEIDPAHKGATELIAATRGRPNLNVAVPDIKPGQAPAGDEPTGETPQDRPAPGVAPAARPDVAMTSADAIKAAALVKEAEGKLRLSDAAAAADKADKALALSPNNPDALLVRAEAKLAQNDAAGALADASKAVALAPASAKGHSLMARAMKALGETRDKYMLAAMRAAQLDSTYEAWLTEFSKDGQARQAAAAALGGKGPAPAWLPAMLGGQASTGLWLGWAAAAAVGIGALALGLRRRASDA